MKNQKILFPILVFGSLWGLSEIILGKMIISSHFPLKGALLTGVGVGILGLALKMYKNPIILLGTSFIAFLCKIIGMPLLVLPGKVNASIAVLITGSLMAFSSYLLIKKNIFNRLHYQVLIPFLTVLLSAFIFFNVGVHLAPCSYLLSYKRPGGVFDFMMEEGFKWAFFSACFFSISYNLKYKVEEKIFHLETKNPHFYYGISVAFSFFSVIMCILITRGIL